MSHRLQRQPDDPGHTLGPTIGVVRFVPQDFGREYACIGDNPVGFVEPIRWGRLQRFAYRTTLFEAPLQFKADSVVRAKVALLHRIADWHDLAGPLYAEHARLIRLQADEIAP
jgi:hypothetical protein